MSLITFVKIVARCGLWLVIAYASIIGNDVLKYNLSYVYLCWKSRTIFKNHFVELFAS
jgi:hypothetical protein